MEKEKARPCLESIRTLTNEMKKSLQIARRSLSITVQFWVKSKQKNSKIKCKGKLILCGLARAQERAHTPETKTRSCEITYCLGVLRIQKQIEDFPVSSIISVKSL